MVLLFSLFILTPDYSNTNTKKKPELFIVDLDPVFIFLMNQFMTAFFKNDGRHIHETAA